MRTCSRGPKSRNRSDGDGHRDGPRRSVCREINRWIWWLSNRCCLRCRRNRWTLKRTRKKRSKNGTLPLGWKTERLKENELKEKKERKVSFFLFLFHCITLPLGAISFPFRSYSPGARFFSNSHIVIFDLLIQKVVLSNFPLSPSHTFLRIFPHFSSIHPLDLFRSSSFLIQRLRRFPLDVQSKSNSSGKKQLLMNWIVGCLIGCRVDGKKENNLFCRQRIDTLRSNALLVLQGAFELGPKTIDLAFLIFFDPPPFPFNVWGVFHSTFRAKAKAAEKSNSWWIESSAVRSDVDGKKREQSLLGPENWYTREQRTLHVTLKKGTKKENPSLMHQRNTFIFFLLRVNWTPTQTSRAFFLFAICSHVLHSFLSTVFQFQAHNTSSHSRDINRTAHTSSSSSRGW